MSDPPPSRERRTFGLLAATGVGVGAIVGGGVLVLAGVAFDAAGPGALLAFALNFVVAGLTALSFAEMSTAFPESGGAYVFAKKVLNVRAAFAVGWVLWFAYIVGAVLYALGFAEYTAELVAQPFRWSTGQVPSWLGERRTIVALALTATGGYTLALIRRSGGGGSWATPGKLAVFAVLIAGGVWALLRRGGDPIADDFRPFLPHGAGGVLAAMGATFIAVQGFELVATIGGEVREPARTIPRAMFLSLGLALLVYLPLLFVTITAGTPAGSGISELAKRHPDTVMAVAVRQFMGIPGYYLVVIAAILSTLSALHACLLAASRVASTMAGDRTLPRVLAGKHPVHKTPLMALYATALSVAAILFMVPDLASAGAAAGLIFLVSFALAHWTALLARRRAGASAQGFRTPAFPLVPVVGGVACAGLAVLQAVSVPAAGAIAGVWLGLGVILYFALFASRAEVVDAFAEAHDPRLARLRGRTPVVLVPVANPDSAAGLVQVGSALAPPEVGRVVLLNVMRRPEVVGEEPPEPLVGAQSVLTQAMTAALRTGHCPEALMTIADAPWEEIARVARARQCACVLLGLTRLDASATVTQLEDFLNDVDCDVAVLNAPTDWRLQSVRRVLVPVGGRGSQHELRARLLGSLRRSPGPEITFLRVVPARSDREELEAARTALGRLAEEEARGKPRVEVVASDDPTAVVREHATEADLLVLGLPRVGGRTLFGDFALQIARQRQGATVMLSQGR